MTVRRAPLTLTLFLLVSTFAVAAGADSRHQRPPERRVAKLVLLDQAFLEARLDEVMERIARVRVLAEGPLRHGERRSLMRELRTAREEIVAIRTLVRGAPEGHAGAVVPPVRTVIIERTPPPAPALHEPMAPGDFERALASITDPGFADERLGALTQVARHNWFLVDQAKQILAAFAHADDGLKALRILAPRVVDPENGHVLLSSFTFSDDKEAAQRILDAIPARP